jgi:hypothetical protein
MQRNDPALPHSIPSLQSGLGGFRHLYQLSIKTRGILSVVSAPVTIRAKSDHVLWMIGPAIGHTVKMVALKIRTL